MNDTTETARPVRRLKRSLNDRVFAGVCGGLADYLGISAVGIRIVWFIMALAGGTGIVAYLIAIFLIPNEQPVVRRAPRPSGSGRLIFGLLLILFGSLIMLRHWFWFPFDFFSAFWKIVLPVGLILIGIAIMAMRPKRAVEIEQTAYIPEPEAQPISPPREPIMGSLRRSRRDKVLFGVCGGLAEKWQVDSALVRVGWAAGTLLTHGFGLLVYLLLLAVIPLEPARTPPADSTVA